MTAEHTPAEPYNKLDLLESSDDFEVIASPYDRMEYVHLTDELIRRLEGTDDHPKPDYVIYLDKSARPVSWLVRELWDDLARELGTKFEDRVIPERPKSLFLNIDSKHHFEKSDIPGLRSLFTTEVVENLDGIEDKPTYFDGKRVLVVDEIGVTHATRVKAQAYLEMAFPEATIDTFTWMDQGPQSRYGGNGAPPSFDKQTFRLVKLGNPIEPQGVKNNLRWYRDRSNLQQPTVEELRAYGDGRGVIDRDTATEKELKGLEKPRLRLGKKWLSVVPETLQPVSKQLMKEIKLLGSELRSGALPYWPSDNREDFAERLEQANGIDVHAFREFREWFKETWWVDWNTATVAVKYRKPSLEAFRSMKHKSAAVAQFAVKHGLYSESVTETDRA